MSFQLIPARRDSQFTVPVTAVRQVLVDWLCRGIAFFGAMPLHNRNAAQSEEAPAIILAPFEVAKKRTLSTFNPIASKDNSDKFASQEQRQTLARTPVSHTHTHVQGLPQMGLLLRAQSTEQVSKSDISLNVGPCLINQRWG